MPELYIYICTHYTGQISSTPDNARISVGQNITIVCNTGGGVIPSLRINGDPTDYNDQVIAGPSGSVRTFVSFLAL